MAKIGKDILKFAFSPRLYQISTAGAIENGIFRNVVEQISSSGVKRVFTWCLDQPAQRIAVLKIKSPIFLQGVDFCIPFSMAPTVPCPELS